MSYWTTYTLLLIDIFGDNLSTLIFIVLFVCVCIYICDQQEKPISYVILIKKYLKHILTGD
jgi:hypothetical protein